MMFRLGVFVLLINCHRVAIAQLTVSILKIEEGQNLDNASVIASYTFPSGFSNPLDWFTEPYANIPTDGSYMGVLRHPVPHNACAPILDHKQRDCVTVCNTTSLNSRWETLRNGWFNLSKLALVDGYHVCTGKKLEHLQQAGFDGVITFSGDDSNQNVNNRVYDNTAKSYVDVASLQYPVAVVSKKFAQTLLRNATEECNSLSDCQQWQPIVVRIKGDSSRQGWIQIAIGIALVVVVVGVPLITCIVVCLCCVCCCASCRCKAGSCGCGSGCGGGGCGDSCKDCCTLCYEKCNKSGVYEVHELQHQVLGPEDDVARPRRPSTRESLRREEHLREREESLHNLRRSESESNSHSAQFRRTYETSTFKEREFTKEEKENCKACAICLSEFDVGEKVCVLPCDDGHIFHVGCIQEWLQTNSVCPVCRTFISIPNH